MKKILATLSLAILIAVPFTGSASPDQDLKDFKKYYMDRFPNTPFDDFINGVYSIDAASRAQWEEIEEFPPYELNISKGEALFNKPFANGKTYASCFENGGMGIRQNYPYFDTDRGEVITLELAINECRDANGEKRLKWKRVQSPIFPPTWLTPHAVKFSISRFRMIHARWRPTNAARNTSTRSADNSTWPAPIATSFTRATWCAPTC